MVDELTAAIEAAQAAGQVLLEFYGHPHDVKFKGPIDIVTEVDVAAEKRIVDILHTATPEYGFLTEENPQVTRGDARWIVDPLDGTVNYAQGCAHFCVSIALERRGELEVGVIYEPVRRDLYCAKRGSGATWNGKSIHVARTGTLAEAVVSTGFPYDAWSGARDNLAEVGYMVKHVRGLRSTGSAALDLAAVASGTRDVHWETGLAPYDIAAGTLLVREAGGIATDYAGNQDVLKGGEMLAANPALHAVVLSFFMQNRSDAPSP